VGNTLDYVYEVSGDTLFIWAGAKGSPAYFKGQFSDDGNATFLEDFTAAEIQTGETSLFVRWRGAASVGPKADTLSTEHIGSLVAARIGSISDPTARLGLPGERASDSRRAQGARAPAVPTGGCTTHGI
jgi:hypothetical protein